MPEGQEWDRSYLTVIDMQEPFGWYETNTCIPETTARSWLYEPQKKPKSGTTATTKRSFVLTTVVIYAMSTWKNYSAPRRQTSADGYAEHKFPIRHSRKMDTDKPWWQVSSDEVTLLRYGNMHRVDLTVYYKARVWLSKGADHPHGRFVWSQDNRWRRSTSMKNDIRRDGRSIDGGTKLKN
jgi:hypothetical protein